MNRDVLKEKIPTFLSWWETRQKARQNQLPRHLRPMPIWPVKVQCVLNLAVFYFLYSLMVDQDDYLTDAGPAMIMAACLILLLFTLPTAIRMKRRYQGLPGQRWTKVNFWLMGLALVMWPLTVAFYL